MPVTAPNQPVPTVAGEVNLAITKGQRQQGAVQRARVKPVWTGEDVNISADLAPITLFMEKMNRSVEVERPDYFHLERDILPISVHASLGQNTTDVTLTLLTGEGARITGGQVLKVQRTGEELRVSSTWTAANGSGTGDVVPVQRGFGNTQISAINAGEEIMIEGLAALDGERSGDGVSSEPLIKINYCQIFRAAYELSGRDMNLGVYGEEEMARVRNENLERMLLFREKTFIFSTSSALGTGLLNDTASKTMGLDGALSTNVTIQAGALSELSLYDNFIRPWHRRNHGQKNMYCFCGELFARALDQFGLGAIRYRPDDDVIGIDTIGYKTSLGDVKTHLHGLFSQVGSSIAAIANGPQGYAFGLNMDKIGMRHFKGRKLKLYENRQLPDVDGKKWEWIDDSGLAVKGEQLHVKIQGITG